MEELKTSSINSEDGLERHQLNMKLFLLIAALFALAYAQDEMCDKYCRGVDYPPNCVPYFMNFSETACYRQCYNNCRNVGINTCLTRYRCCMAQSGFNNNGCQGLMS